MSVSHETLAEREACARLVEEWNGKTRVGDTFFIAEAIRARTQGGKRSSHTAARAEALNDAAALVDRIAENYGDKAPHLGREVAKLIAAEIRKLNQSKDHVL